MATISEEKQSAWSGTINIIKTSIYNIWHFHRRLVLGLIILLATILVVLRSFAFYLEQNPHIVQALIESYLQNPVSFETMHVQINPLFPSVSLTDFVIKDKDNNKNHLDFSLASIKLNLPLSIIRGQGIIDTLTLQGFNTVVRRNKDGIVTVAGLELPGTQEKVQDKAKTRSSYSQLFNQTKFIISNSQVFFIDDLNEYPSVFVSDINLEMINKNKRHQISLQASLDQTETSLDVRLDFTGKIDDIRNWDGQIYTAIDKFHHGTVLKFIEQKIIQIENYQIDDIEGGVRLWSQIEQGNLQSIKGELSIKGVSVKRIDTEKAIRFDHLKTFFKLKRYAQTLSGNATKADNWAMDLYDLNLNLNSKPIVEKRISLRYQKNMDSQSQQKDSALQAVYRPQLQLFLNHLDLGKLSHVIAFFSPKEFNKTVLQVLKPKGTVENIIATVSAKSLVMPIDITHYQVQADIKGYSSNAFLAMPKIRNLSTHVVFNETMGRAIIDSHDMKLHLKNLFRDNWPITDLTGEVFWQKENEGWLFGGDNLMVKNPHLAGKANVKLWFQNNGQTLMDLTGFYQDANVKYTSYYLPVAIMSEGLVQWLDEAILSGFGTDGGVVFRGNLNEFPFANHSGIMDIVFHTKDVVLEYEKDWPKVTDIKALVQFTEQGMWVDAQQSKIFSATSDNTRVTIERYLDPLLRIKGDLKTNVEEGTKFLQQSSLVSDDVLDIIDARDNININLNLSIPLETGEPDSIVKITLKNADYFPPGFERKQGLISNLKGEVVVHNQAIEARNLNANIMGLPASVVIKTTMKSAKSGPVPDIKVLIDTSMSVQQLKKYQLLPTSFSHFSNNLSGVSDIKLAIELPNDIHPLAFSINSDLQGIESRLPSPFYKSAKASKPLKLNYSENKVSKKGQTARISLSISEIISLALLLDISHEEFALLRGHVNLGSSHAQLPKNDVLKISGSLIKPSLEQWQTFLSSQPPVKGRTKKDSSKAFIPIEIAMKKVVFPELSGGQESKMPGTSSAAAKQSILNNEVGSLVPDQFPLLNGRIESVQLGQANLGVFSIQSSRVEQGIIFDSIELKGDRMSFSGKGKWHQWTKVPEVDMEGEMQIPSLEKFLPSLGFDQLIRNGDAKVYGYVSWPGGLDDFSKATIDGKLSLRVKNGTYLEGKPGTAGRLLGLLNMNALARRISLDFTDVSSKGFEFDSIKGDFRIVDGNARTENLRIRAPSTKILLTGRTGLITEDFDQQVTVIPEVSATLPIAGAAVAGPAGAAVVWVGQKLLGEQINRATAFGYTVKGSWQDPIIKRDKRNRKALKTVKTLFSQDEKVQNDSLKPEFDSDDVNLP